VYVAAYPTDSVGIIRAANEIGLTPKMFGGTLIGLLITPIKAQLGPLINGIVNNEVFVPGPAFTFPGTLELLASIAKSPKAKGSTGWGGLTRRLAMRQARFWPRLSRAQKPWIR